MARQRSVLVGVDFLPASMSALAQAARRAQREGGAVHAAHVVDEESATDFFERTLPDWNPDVLRESLLESAKRDLAACLERAEAGRAGSAAGGDVAARVHVELGDPLRGLLAIAERIGPELIFVGTHGVSDPGGGVGTLAARVAARARADVMLVRADHAGPFRSVAVGIDFSPTSGLALRRAAGIARDDGATLRVVHVYSRPLAPYRFGMAPDVRIEQLLGPYRASLMEEMRAFCEPWVGEMPAPSVLFELVEHTSHGSGITELVRREGVELVVLGTRGRTNLRDLLIGSTAERVVRNAPCSVLAVRPATEPAGS